MMNWEEMLHKLVVRQEEIQKGELPFLELGTIKEEFVFNEYKYIGQQIDLILKHLKEENS